MITILIYFNTINDTKCMIIKLVVVVYFHIRPFVLLPSILLNKIFSRKEVINKKIHFVQNYLHFILSKVNH